MPLNNNPKALTAISLGLAGLVGPTLSGCDFQNHSERDNQVVLVSRETVQRTVLENAKLNHLPLDREQNLRELFSSPEWLNGPPIEMKRWELEAWVGEMSGKRTES